MQNAFLFMEQSNPHPARKAGKARKLQLLGNPTTLGMFPYRAGSHSDLIDRSHGGRLWCTRRFSPGCRSFTINSPESSIQAVPTPLTRCNRKPSPPKIPPLPPNMDMQIPQTTHRTAASNSLSMRCSQSTSLYSPLHFAAQRYYQAKPAKQPMSPGRIVHLVEVNFLSCPEVPLWEIAPNC
jgi:hypothetical protein